MGNIKVQIDKVYGVSVKPEAVAALRYEIEDANSLLHSGTGAGSDYLGWVNLPSSINKSDLDDIQSVANVLRNDADVIIVIGIGGSYLGGKAVLDALGSSFESLVIPRKGVSPRVIFAGQNISEDYTWELMDAVKDYDIATVVVSKSGMTTEPAISFRIIRGEIERRYGKDGAARRIVAVTDESKGALRSLADTEGYKSFVIPDNIGGRFSVLTPVGLLPFAVAGIDIHAFVAGAVEMERITDVKGGLSFGENPAMQYAAARTALYRAGKKIEILASYEPKLQNIGEWWKQLYGESEGKDGKGIFPAAVTLTADLHSMGQYIQDGERTLFETVIRVGEPNHTVKIGTDAENLDGLNFLSGRRISEVNEMARLGTMLAHLDGGVPNIVIEIPRVDAHSIGGLLYMFEKACGISGYALGVNPFDQPGVEAYKANMFALLGKPGYEADGEALRARL